MALQIAELKKTTDQKMDKTIQAFKADLAKVRTVDLDSIQEGGQLLPALYFAFNTDKESVPTSFASITPQEKR